MCGSVCNKRNYTMVELRGGRIIKVDDCMASMLANTRYKTLGCCCGHGIYKKTLVIRKGKNNLEHYSGKVIPRKRRFYLKDEKGYYFIPEV